MDLFKLVGTIAINNAEANKALDETQKQVSETKDEISNSGSGMTGTFKKVGAAVATYFTVDAVKNFGLGCIGAASDANAASSQFTQVFGDLEGNASKSLISIADEAGISENRMKGSFTKIAAFAKTTGMDTEGALALSERAMVAVADSAAFYDQSLEDTTERLQSFLKGNYENDAALGLSCTETTRNAAANELYGKSFKDLSESQKQLTLLQMVEDANATSGALGQAARESDTWTNQTGNLKQAWTDLQAVLGANVLPKAVDIIGKLASGITSLVEKMPEAVKWFKEHETTIQMVAIVVGTLTAAITAYNAAQGLKNIAVAAGVAAEGSATVAMGLHTVATNIATAATSAFGAVMSFITSPITLVVVAIGALIAIGVLLYKNWDVVKEKCLELWTKVKEIWGNIKESIGTIVENIKTVLTEKFNAAKEKVVSIFNSVKETLSNVWNAITNVIKIAIQVVVSIIDAAFQLITLPWRFIWENCKEYIIAAWNAIKSAVKTAIDAVKSTITTIMNAIKNFISTTWDAIKTKISSVMNAIKSVVIPIWNAIKSGITNVVNAIKSTVTSIWNSIKSVTSSVFNAVKSVASSVWNGIKNTIANVVDGVKSKVSSVFNSVKSTVSSVFNGIKSTATSVWNGVKNAITTPIEAAKNKVKSVVDAIKGFFSGMKLKFPNIALPHFGISPKGWKIGDLLKGKIPKLSISWYQKAMARPMIMTKPTVFGYNAATGQLMGGGEAGSEVVSGTNTLMNMIASAVAAQNEVLVYYIQKIIEILATYFPQVIEALQNMELTFEDGTVAARLAPAMDTELGKLKTRKDRGR